MYEDNCKILGKIVLAQCFMLPPHEEMNIYNGLYKFASTSKSVSKICALNSIKIEKNLVYRIFNQTLVNKGISMQFTKPLITVSSLVQSQSNLILGLQ